LDTRASDRWVLSRLSYGPAMRTLDCYPYLLSSMHLHKRAKPEADFGGILLDVDRGAEGLSCLSAAFGVVLLLVCFVMKSDRALEFLP